MLFVAPVHEPKGQKSDELRENDISMTSKEQVIGLFRQTGENEQPQSILPPASGMPVALGNGPEEDGGGNTADVVRSVKERFKELRGDAGEPFDEKQCRRINVGNVVIEHGEQGDEL